jgi:hypothetical protein
LKDGKNHVSPLPLKKKFQNFSIPLWIKVFSAGKGPKDVGGGKDYKRFFRGQFKVSHVIKSFTVWFHGHAATQ